MSTKLDAHLQCEKNHYRKFEYEEMKTFFELLITPTRHLKSVADGQMDEGSWPTIRNMLKWKS